MVIEIHKGGTTYYVKMVAKVSLLEPYVFCAALLSSRVVLKMLSVNHLCYNYFSVTKQKFRIITTIRFGFSAQVVLLWFRNISFNHSPLSRGKQSEEKTIVFPMEGNSLEQFSVFSFFEAKDVVRLFCNNVHQNPSLVISHNISYNS